MDYRDWYPDGPENGNHTGKKKRNRRERDLRYRNRLKLLSGYCTGVSGAIYADWGSKPYYRRCYRSGRKNHRFKVYMKYANRKVRKYRGEIHKGGAYRKVFDYWWSVD